MGSADITLNGGFQSYNGYDVGTASPESAGEGVQGQGSGQPVAQPGSAPVMSPDAVKVVNEAVSVLRGASSILLDKDVQNAIHDIIPEIDPADIQDLGEDLAALEQLIAELTLTQEEAQAKALASKIDAKVKELAAKHDEIVKQIQNSIDLAVEQEKKAQKNKILGWIMMALGIVALAVSIAATAVTGGGSLAIAGCVLAGLSTLVSVTTTVLNETGMIEKWLDDAAKEYAKSHEVSYAEAKKHVQNVYQGIMIAVQVTLSLASLGCGIGSLVQAGKAAADAGKGLGEVAMTAAKAKALLALRIVQAFLQTASIGGSTASSVLSWKLLYLNKELSENQAELKELQALMEKIEAVIEEYQDRLAEILQQMQDTLDVVLEVLTSSIDEVQDILKNMVQSQG